MCMASVLLGMDSSLEVSTLRTNSSRSMQAMDCLIPKNASVALMTGDTMDMNTTRK